MNDGLVSQRYAKALFQYAAGKGEDRALYDRMRMVDKSFASTPRLREVLANPVLGREDKQAVMLSAAGDGRTEESLTGFVNLLLDNGRESLMRSIALRYIAIYHEIHNISIVKLTSAQPLPGFVTDRIKSDVEGYTHGRVETSILVDESIKGGFIFQLDDLRLDASIQGQLERIKRQFIQKNRAII